MALVERLRIDATVTASGGASQVFYTPRLTHGGYLESIVYTNATVSGFSSAGHFEITCEQSGQVLLSVTSTGSTASGVVPITYYPRGRSVAPNAKPYASPTSQSGSTNGIPTLMAIGQEAIKLVVSSGAAGTSAGKHFLLDFYVRR